MSLLGLIEASIKRGRGRKSGLFLRSWPESSSSSSDWPHVVLVVAVLLPFLVVQFCGNVWVDGRDWCRRPCKSRTEVASLLLSAHQFVVSQGDFGGCLSLTFD